MEPNDRQLLQRCRTGDHTAWEHLIQRYSRLIYAIPRRAGMDHDLANDIFQQVCTKLYQNLDKIEQPDRLQAWIVTTARRETWRYQRKQGRYQPLHDETSDESAIVDTTQGGLPDETVIALEQQHLIRSTLNQLDERCQNLISMLFYRTSPPAYAEIAQALGISEGSIGPTRARCLQKLAKLLEPYGL